MFALIRVFSCLLVFPLAAVAHCGKAGCNTLVFSPVPYNGQATATEPYLDTGELYNMYLGCDRYSCSISTQIKTYLHNPTTKPIISNITCKFLVGEAEVANRTLKAVKVPARKSLQVEVNQVMSVLQDYNTEIGVECDAVFHAIFAKSVPKGIRKPLVIPEFHKVK